MSYTHLLARALSNSNGHRAVPKNTAIIIAVIGGVLFGGISMIYMVCKSKRKTPANDPESLAAQVQQRRENGGTWGPEPPRTETAVERRRRNLEIRETMGGGSGVVGELRGETREEAAARLQQRRENGGTWGPDPPRIETAVERRRRNLEIRETMGGGSGVVRNPRRETREEEAPPPVYQPPAPTHDASPELRRERLGDRPLPPLVGDAPPAYDSPAVWPTRT